MSTDRVLLELAAKAAGMDIEWQPCGWAHDNNTGCEWNPLTADGDAFRLAVKLGLSARPYALDGTAECRGHYEVHHHGEVQCMYAATRRAIVRAAAEIGRSKE